MVPGINKLYYNGSYWPAEIESCLDPEICGWLSRSLFLIPLDPRPEGYDPLKEKNLKRDFVKELAESGDLCWKSILKRNVTGLGKALTSSFMAWKKMLPNTVPDRVMQEMETKYLSGIRVPLPREAVVVMRWWLRKRRSKGR